MSKEDILKLSEEDMKILDKMKALAKSKLKKESAGAARAIDYIWEKIMLNDNHTTIKILCKNGINSWRDLTEHQIYQLPQAFYKSMKALDTTEKDLRVEIDKLNEQVKTLTEQINNLKNENALLKEKENIKFPKDVEEIKRLAERDLILKKLEIAGVDNWCGYEDAINSVLSY